MITSYLVIQSMYFIQYCIKDNYWGMRFISEQYSSICLFSSAGRIFGPQDAQVSEVIRNDWRI